LTSLGKFDFVFFALCSHLLAHFVSLFETIFDALGALFEEVLNGGVQEL
jgi:hypothetical protein